MAWNLEVTDDARKQLRKIDQQTADRITRAMIEVARLENPRVRGHALTGNLIGLWRFRVGDWRVIVRIENEKLVIVVIDVGHRSKVYR